MNISELARRLRTHPDELREKLPLLGFDVGHRAIKVDDRLVNKIMEKWSEMMKLERLKAKYKREAAIKEVAIAKVKKVELPKVITVRDFAGKLALPLNIVIGELMKNGILASLNERIDFETASIVAEDLGYEVGQEGGAVAAEAGLSTESLKTMLESEAESNLVTRAPVVVVMGHVDHGKTALLDAVRKTDVAKGEAGGITQHIGAYQKEKKGRKITFIDTPGHEAFTVMRSRGARVADVGVLVVALDDGVQPQTVEVIKIISAAKLPFVVALNKADKSDADMLQKVKTQLSEQGLIPEDWGGKTIMVPVSAKTGQGIDDLLDMILLVADMDKDKIRANPERRAVGTIIESHVDKGEGPVATMLVQSGTLRRNDILSVGGALYGRVRAMKDWNGKMLEAAGPSVPVKVLGFKIAPAVGDVCEVPEDATVLKQVKKQYAVEKQSSTAVAQPKKEEGGVEKKMVNVVLKADVLGSLEAIIGTLEKMQTPEVGVAIVGRGLGNISDGDIERAAATGGVVMGFNVLATREAELLARDRKVEVHRYKIIYELFDEVKIRLQTLLPAEVITTPLGKLEVLAVFRADKTGQVVGGRVTEGKIQTGANVVVYRSADPVGEGSIVQLQTGKTDTKEVRQGTECGLKVTCRTTILVGDVLDVYTEEKRERVLAVPR
ncbi:translation initiation factor IF-2 [Candidatus Uhrbacteria bacterium RIFCSPHIGHO2_02_FULL_60_10]|uniref:Translation initiation factor IF-2 n=1 Tax=Candidatus Uhrbacteria bacterium RIFCSPHIGHO2_02_FULL_60_10 TaxID=1802392 RepID=A0A1F7U8D4_9BACT|nr:MAG: translation initiation factor IF-2 [Candidatus Uhrbacteria bacterium RIFCSPHIGHO2_02_FULL_60_10]